MWQGGDLMIGERERGERTESFCDRIMLGEEEPQNPPKAGESRSDGTRLAYERRNARAFRLAGGSVA